MGTLPRQILTLGVERNSYLIYVFIMKYKMQIVINFIYALLALNQPNLTYGLLALNTVYRQPLVKGDAQPKYAIHNMKGN